MSCNKSIAYLFKTGRVERTQCGEDYPDDFFYGYKYVRNKIENTKIIDISKMGISGPMNYASTALTVPFLYLTGLHLAVIFRILNKNRKNKLNESEVLIASTTSLGTAIALLKTLGVIKSKLVFIIMGLGDLLNNPLRRYILKRILDNTIVVSISKGEMEHISKALNGSVDVKYLPFGVDSEYWVPSSKKSSNYILSIGNDLNRDYETLLSIWKPEYPELKVITRHKLSSSLDNVKIINGDWNQQVLTDEQIKIYIQQANFIVVPVKQTSQPSGQSFCLQSMACGKAVVMSDIAGLWDKNALKDGENCLLYEPENKKSLANCIDKLINQNELKKNIENQARCLVETKFNSAITGSTILKYLNTVVSM